MEHRPHLLPISATSPDWAQAVALYEQAFPPCERRDTAAWQRLLTSEPLFCAEAIHAEEVFVGFISFWDFGRFVYVEHFAVCPDVRGGGIGGSAIDAFRDSFSPRPIVLEVELPDTPMAIRRIHFYERHDFSLLSADYRQPPYRPADAWLPLQLMATPSAAIADHIDEVKALIYKHVYGYEQGAEACAINP